MLGNKEIMSANIRYYMEQKKVNSAEVCKALKIKQNTFSNWVNAKIYPRIDKIELLANYFGISKADLVEERPKEFDNPALFEIEWRKCGGAAHRLILTKEEEEFILKVRSIRSFDADCLKRLLKYVISIEELYNANR